MTFQREPLLVRKAGDATVLPVLRRYDDFGLVSVDLVGPPRRFWADGEVPVLPIVDMGIDANRVEAAASPAEVLNAGPTDETWSSLTRRSLARLRAYFLLAKTHSAA